MARKGRARRFREARQLKQGFDDGLFAEGSGTLADVSGTAEDEERPEDTDTDTDDEGDEDDEDDGYDWDPDKDADR